MGSSSSLQMKGGGLSKRSGDKTEGLNKQLPTKRKSHWQMVFLSCFGLSLEAQTTDVLLSSNQTAPPFFWHERPWSWWPLDCE